MLKLMQSEDRIVRRNACMAMGVMTAHRGCLYKELSTCLNILFFIFFHLELIDNANLKCGFNFLYIGIIFFSAEVRKFLRKREESVPAFIQLLAPEG